jgi:multiple sugar transport system substrate-binding protein/raffinose/stachyose/melibiose transport system substrate-binding protein
MRRITLFSVLFVLALAGLLAGCAAPAAAPAAPAADTAATAAPADEGAATGGLTGKLVYNSYQSDPAPREVDAALVAQFQAANPGLEITHSTVAHEDFKQAIRTYLAASTPPDVMTWFAGNRARFFIDKGLIMDISDVFEQQGWLEDFPKGFVALSTVDDKQYFVPTSYYWWALYYNKTVLEENGLEPPTTWDELLNACSVLKTAGITPISIGTKAPWTAAAWFDYLNMRINGPEFHINLMLGTEKYDDPRVKKVFEYWAELLNNGCFTEDAASYEWQAAVTPLVQGEAGMYLMGQFIMDSIPEDQRANFDFVRFPIIDPSVPIGEDAPTDGFFASASAPNPEAAKAFLAFIGSKEAQEYVAKELLRVPVHSGVDPSIFPPETLKGIDLLQGADYVAQFYDRDTTPEMAERGMAAFQQFWSNPADIDNILAQLEKDRALIFSEEQE